ncbi:MAG TPA: hypothetical protein VFZ09_21220 [Archangium sp.]|uniref:hypothetical protein n=1 Tax=Archangium sp. TaxID=1872627 RepID=UPI002E3795D0|nr:hypothetical protein [Archangium sp.]HEX5748776.1 hypothetical protein [Archangium sp.]
MGISEDNPGYGYGDNELVVPSNWTVTFVEGQLAVSCTVAPKNAWTDAITNLYVGLTSPTDTSKFYCSGSVTAVHGSPPSGNAMTGFSQTYLYEPKAHGNTVRSIVFGYVQTSLGSSSFMLQRLFTVGTAGGKPKPGKGA